MKIGDIEITEYDDYNELSGQVGDFRLWYRFPKELELRTTADPFLAASLIPAMYLGEDIEITDNFSVSPRLRENVKVIQKTYLLWNEFYRENYGKEFKPISVRGGADLSSESCDESVSFFSGGIDGLDTFLRNIDHIDYLIFVEGIDMQLDNELYSEAFEENRRFLAAYGKRLMPVKTNVRFLGHHFGAGWQSCCSGSGLASIALAGRFKSCLVASSNSHNYFCPDGSNAITDPMWGNGYTEIIYEGGEFLRTEKTRHIANKAPEALGILRVCWQDKGYNCGSCDKCLRTMVTLKLLGLTASTLPQLTKKDFETIKSSTYYREDDLIFHKENLELAQQVNDKELVRALRRPIRRYRTRKLAKDFLKLVRGELN